MLVQAIECEWISCDRCEYLDAAEKWLDRYSPSLRQFLIEKQDLDIKTPRGQYDMQFMFAGAACPSCGNFSEIDMDPFNKRGEKMTTEEVLRFLRESPEKITLALAQFSADMKWIDENRTTLLRTFQNMWVAVYQGKIVASATDISKLKEFLRAQGLLGSEAAVEYMDPNPPHTIPG